MNIGRWRRALSALSIAPLPSIGTRLAVEVTTMSACASREGISSRVMASHATRAASDLARSSDRLATIMRSTPFSTR